MESGDRSLSMLQAYRSRDNKSLVCIGIHDSDRLDVIGEVFYDSYM
jgi:hypothetical protein